MAENDTFLIPIDHDKFDESCMDKDLLFDLINGRQNRVLNKDFTIFEKTLDHLRAVM